MVKHPWRAICSGLTCVFGMCIFASADEVQPFPFAGDVRTVDLKEIRTNGSAVSRTSTQGHEALLVDAGHKTDYPGISIRAPHGNWDLTPYAEVRFAIKNVGTNVLALSCRVDNPGADGKNKCVTGDLTLAPGESGTMVAKLDRGTENPVFAKLFGMRGFPDGWGRSGSIDPANITQLIVFLTRPNDDHGFEITSIEAAGKYVAPLGWVSEAKPFFPFVDEFGQYKHATWPGKIKSTQEFEEVRTAEDIDLKAHVSPENWDRYGGWADGPALKATGFFRTDKVKEKWWLVDPAGHLFFSNGIDCVGYGDITPIEERTNWFVEFPGQDPKFSAFLTKDRAIMGHYAGRSPGCFSFSKANLLRRYGSEWQKIYPRFVHRRLRSWGINTMGNWSDRSITVAHTTPYVETLNSTSAKMIDASTGFWGKFPDVFDPSFALAVKHSMEGAPRASTNVEWCIGFFCDNEMSWGNDTSLAMATLASGPTQEAKKVFIADLKTKYGDVAKLNAAWGTTIESWAAMLQQPSKPDPAKARVDLTAFYSKLADQYFRIVRDVVKKAAPNQLYLGCRFAAGNPLASAAAAKYCDVVSFNIYKPSVANFVFDGNADVPVLIGEFHFGALDRGLFSQGLVPVPNQQERAKSYREYVAGALHHPQIVGCHWFQYRDEPLIGRVWDGENYQIGFVDVADSPYQETIAACREAGYHLYK